ncbi:serine/threonine-protein phosphatase 4 regulatory subunit 2-like [Odontomachus brunneus]|uniref:serine/threonine-protein phosphatase 4 regulatory subunit 2-like n=1 Tax=Odontomachus brunneus TaxID=486640 RepID=UPI0013F1EBDD|nr:serine/threonine-protein phosphatase 4 regulatory subunit 2-like [Odontomachus brunneus]
MENLEEVLQALDEFQKMRPTEIPRELEEYLCWVAKTGDPVYQWPMIKTLFREKLTRVMTDFYESCPTLELAACPNVEHFNYDTMKSNLLERLESFANAPFTVQRICELLTAPRKEYNRVDKFMRAIEKNILVVSTREPGPINRRGETGDGMVNGSVEEDTASVTQQQQQPPPPSPQTTQSAAQDVEMEWEKDCASTVTISVHTVENETSLLHTVVPGAAAAAAAAATAAANSAAASTGGALAKNAVFSVDETAREKLEQAVSRSDQLTTSNFVGATSSFSAISNLTSQVEQSHEPVVAAAASVVQNLSTPAEAIVAEDSLGSADVADVIMNEDTNSQASLDMENDEVDPATAVTTTTATTTTTTTTAAAAATVTTTPATTSPSTTASTTSASSSPSSSSSSSSSSSMSSSSSSSSTSSSSSSSSSSSATTTVTVVATVIPLTTDTTRNLQAAFQAKRFEDADEKCSDKPNEKTTAAAVADSPGLVHSTKSGEVAETECGDVNGIPRDESRITESDSLKTDVEVAEVASGDDEAGDGVVADEERLPSKVEEEAEASPRLDDVDEEKSRCQDAGSADIAQMVFIETAEDNAIASDECANASVVSPEASRKTEKTELQPKGTCATTTTTTTTASSSPKDSRLLHDQTASEKPDSTDVEQVLETIPRLGSPRSDEQMGQELHAEFNGDGTKMMKVSNDKAALVESIVVEPAKEKAREVTAVEKLDSTVSPVIEMIPLSDGSVTDTVVCPCPQDDALMPVAEDDGTTAEQVKVKQSSVVESAACRREPHDQVEMMEVDEDEESASTFQQQQQSDEQMEDETMEELSKS